METSTRALVQAAGFALLLLAGASSGFAGSAPGEGLALQAADGPAHGVPAVETLRAGGAACHAHGEPMPDDHLAGQGGRLPDSVPSYEGCANAIRPGARMTAPVGCTFNFVFREGSDLYIGTAGHCVSVGQRVSAVGVSDFGSVVFSVSEGSADDFALVRIDPDDHARVRVSVCTWGGPTGIGEPPAALDQEFVLEYGWGVATPFTPQTRSRVHDEFLSSGDVLQWNGVGSGGDSGAPLVYEDGRAAGIHTAGLTPVAGVVWEQGPTISRILEIAGDAGYDLELQTAPVRWRPPL